MARAPRHPPLSVRLNGQKVGTLKRETSGAISFAYDPEWLGRESPFPISLSLPLQERSYRGEQVLAVFDNLLPDEMGVRRQIAERVGAGGSDAYSLLAALGHDCVGALQFLPDDHGPAGDDDDDDVDDQPSGLTGDPVDEAGIAALLQGLGRAPLGLGRDEAFRISLAGAQEKTALLRHNGRWLKPVGTTPTSHILKPAIGLVPNGIDLSDSVENEYYCMRLAAVLGLPVAQVEMADFGNVKTLIIERFDRVWRPSEGALLLFRLPQEDLCQALSVPPSRKYQSDGGPGMRDCLRFLSASERGVEDQKLFLKAQLFFWLIGATDGHAKNFSIHLGRRGAFQLTPLYDILTAQPQFDAGKIERGQFRLAMSAGKNRHYRIDEIVGRHFLQTAEAAGMPLRAAEEAMHDVHHALIDALDRLEQELPGDFPAELPRCVRRAVEERLPRLTVTV